MDEPVTDDAAASPTRDAAPSTEGPSREELKSAYNAFKKRWKLTQLDQESRIGRSPLSSGQKSSIAGIKPPVQFPQVIWDELVKQGRLKYTGSGFYGMP